VMTRFVFIKKLKIKKGSSQHRNSRASTISGSIQHIVLDWPKRFQIAVGQPGGSPICTMTAHHPLFIEM